MAVAMQIIHQPKRRIEIPMEEGSPENQSRGRRQSSGARIYRIA